MQTDETRPGPCRQPKFSSVVEFGNFADDWSLARFGIRIYKLSNLPSFPSIFFFVW